MNGIEAIEAMVKSSKKTPTSISLAMGKSRGYLTTKICEKKDPLISTIVKVADECGYDVKLVKKDSDRSITIDVPEE